MLENTGGRFIFLEHFLVFFFFGLSNKPKGGFKVQLWAHSVDGSLVGGT